MKEKLLDKMNLKEMGKAISILVIMLLVTIISNIRKCTSCGRAIKYILYSK